MWVRNGNSRYQYQPMTINTNFVITLGHRLSMTALGGGPEKGNRLWCFKIPHTPFDPTTDPRQRLFETGFEIIGSVQSQPDSQTATTFCPFLLHLQTKRGPDHCLIFRAHKGCVQPLFSCQVSLSFYFVPFTLGLGLDNIQNYHKILQFLQLLQVITPFCSC